MQGLPKARVYMTKAALSSSHSALFQDYENAVDQAATASASETLAAVVIQAMWRMYSVRIRLAVLTRSVLLVQRVWRGHLGRKRYRLAQASADHRVRAAYFSRAATTIQAAFRGYASRAHVFSAIARSQYIAEAVRAAEQVRCSCRERHAMQMAEKESEMTTVRRQAFDSSILSLHPLISTQSKGGVFSSSSFRRGYFDYWIRKVLWCSIQSQRNKKNYW